MFCPACAFEVPQQADHCPRCDRAFPAALWAELAQGETAASTGEAGGAGMLLEGRYRVRQPLAKGGMGEVFEGVDIRLDRKVAIKFLAERLRGDGSLVQRFLLEAQSAAKLDHPNIVTILSVGEEAGRPFLVMRYIPGENLAKRLQARGRLPLEEAVAIACQVCDGLAHIHEHGFVHRDIKPQNLMIEPGGRCRILDFGILRIVARSHTQTLLVAGTPEYMAPEQERDPKLVDARSDLYSLGVTLFQMLTGRPPFQAESPIDLVLKHRSEAVPRASSLVPALPKAVDALLEKALAKAPAARFASASELREGLRALARQPGEARGTSGRVSGVRRVARLRTVAALLVALTGAGVVGAWLSREEVRPVPPAFAEASGWRGSVGTAASGTALPVAVGDTAGASAPTERGEPSPGAPAASGAAELGKPGAARGVQSGTRGHGAEPVSHGTPVAAGPGGRVVEAAPPSTPSAPPRRGRTIARKRRRQVHRTAVASAALAAGAARAAAPPPDTEEVPPPAKPTSLASASPGSASGSPRLTSSTPERAKGAIASARMAESTSRPGAASPGPASASPDTEVAPPSPVAAVPGASPALPYQGHRPGVLHVAVLYEGHATWATLLVDGKKLGELTTARRAVPPGRHRLVARRPGFVDVETLVNLKPGEARKVKLRLVKR